MTRENLSRREMCIGIGAGLMGSLVFPGSVLSANPAPAKSRKSDLVGAVRHTLSRKEDTLLDIARNNKLGYVEMLAANPGVDPWLPGDGTKITLPTGHLLPSGPRQGLLLNLVDQRLYYFPADGGSTQSYPIGTGQEAWDTPRGTTKIVRKKRNPSWYVPKSIRKEDPELPAIVKPGPDNPLGQHALYLGWAAYLIHGTNNPWGVGRRVSHGCIRMYPEDIKSLFPQIPVGAPVTVVSQEMKTGWVNGELLMEVHPNLDQNVEIEKGAKPTPTLIPEMVYRVVQAAGDKAKLIDWKKVKKIARNRSGLPVPVLKPTLDSNKEPASKT